MPKRTRAVGPIAFGIEVDRIEWRGSGGDPLRVGGRPNSRLPVIGAREKIHGHCRLRFWSGENIEVVFFGIEHQLALRYQAIGFARDFHRHHHIVYAMNDQHRAGVFRQDGSQGALVGVIEIARV